MTDPVADQIGQLSDAVRDQAPGQDIAAPAGGLGVTAVDVDALAAQIAALQVRLDAADQAAAVSAGNPLADTVVTIQHFLGGHGDQAAVELGNDLAAAVEAAGQSGDTSAVAKIAARLDRHLTRNAPYAGENYHYRNAASFVSDLPDLIDAYKPAAQPEKVPAKVVAGSVVG